MQKKLLLILVTFIAFPAAAFAADEKPKEESKKFWEDISFEEGTFLGDVNAKAVKLFNQVETWRGKEKDVIKASLDKVEKKRSAEENPKPAIKVLIMAHIFLLAALLFVFSIQTAFYVVLIGLVFWVIRKIFMFIGRLFKRGPETA